MSAIENALDDYQRWTQTTAQYPEALALPYVGLGLGDEAGELLEKVLRGLRLTSVMRDGVVKEGGDTLWYLGQVLLKFDLSLGQAFAASRTVVGIFDSTMLGAAAEVSIHASAIQGRIKKHLRDGIDVKGAVFSMAAHLLHALEDLLRACGSNVLLAAAGNRTKLEDRKDRGVIKGEGDAR